MTVPNFTHIAERFGFDMVTIKSGKLKDIGNSFRAMTEEERTLLESQLAEVHEQFISAVAEGRKIDVSKVRAFGDGRAIMGAEAKRLGLVDEFGDIYDAARAVFDLLGEPLKAEESPKLIYSKDKFEEFRELLKTASRLPNLLSATAEMRFEMR
jgi:protease-4